MSIDERDYVWERSPYNFKHSEKEKRLSAMRRRFEENYESGIVLKQRVPTNTGNRYVSAWGLILGALACYGVVVWVVTTADIGAKKSTPPVVKNAPRPPVTPQAQFIPQPEVRRPEVERVPQIINVGKDCIRPSTALKELECKNREDMARASIAAQNRIPK